MLSCPTDTEKVSGLKIKLIPNPSCWLYFGWKSFSHWRQSWIFIMGFEMDPKSSELHIWSKDMVTCQLYRWKFLLNALVLSSSLCWTLDGVFPCNAPTCENKSVNEAKAAAHSTETTRRLYFRDLNPRPRLNLSRCCRRTCCPITAPPLCNCD